MKPRTISSSCIGFDGSTLIQQSITTDDDDVTVLSRSRFVVIHLVGTVTVKWEGDAGWVDYARTKGESGSFAEDPDYDYGAKICAARISDLLLGWEAGDYTGEELHRLISNFWPSGASVVIDLPYSERRAQAEKTKKDSPVRFVLDPNLSIDKSALCFELARREGRPVRKWVLDGDDSIKGIIMPEDRRTHEKD